MVRPRGSAAHVGDKRDVEALGVGVCVAHDDRHLGDGRLRARAVAALAVDELVATLRGADHERLDQPVRAHGLREPVELGALDVVAGVKALADLREWDGPEDLAL